MPIIETQITRSLELVERLSRTHKLNRFLHHPGRYILAWSHRKLLYPFTKKHIKVNADLFFGPCITVHLPAGTDLYLTGGKTHDSEIRLARYLLSELNEKSYFLDIGAHFGYFSLLAHHCRSKVLAIEASKNTYELLSQNIDHRLPCFNLALSDKPGKITFYEFEQLYSEYNTTQIEQYQKEEWIKKVKYNEIHIEATTIDEIIEKKKFMPTHIKIDVEGHEYPVVLGASQCLKDIQPILIMEYLLHGKSENYRQAHQYLLKHNYQAYSINHQGSLEQIKDIESYLCTQQLTSDNIIYKI